MKKNLNKNGSISLKGKSVRFDEEYLHVLLKDGRMISTPLKWYKPLQKASLQQLARYHFICKETGIEWPDLDYHLSIESMFLGLTHSKVA
ncbi:MAG: DUF2442 domain-containing protein [Deltaproteobacteria bacterium]|nr:DUF2442 domain-containing protein [Deltaproteobacteria bacterium]